jgi:hypothetical protein
MTRKNITLQDVLDRVLPFEKIDPATLRWGPDLGKLEEHLMTGTFLSWNEKFEERVKAAAINEWLCTDTMVGVYAIYLDGRFVALSFQSARKNDTTYYWNSTEDAKAMREFIRSLSDEADPFEASLIKPDITFPAWWLEPEQVTVRNGRKERLPPHCVEWHDEEDEDASY